MITNSDDLIRYIDQCVDKFDSQQSRMFDTLYQQHVDCWGIKPSILDLPGMSSERGRCFLNELMKYPEIRSYLEIGVWQGSTFLSSLYENKHIERAVAIDNWSEFTDATNYPHDSIEDGFRSHVDLYSKFLPDHISIIRNNSWAVDTGSLGKFDAYFYDGCHDVEDQELALTYYWDNLEDTFLFMVDDWNLDEAKIGTKNAFNKLPMRELERVELPAIFNEDTVNYWNGILISVIQKI